MTTTFQPGDEIEWRADGKRVRGRVVLDRSGTIGALVYDDLRRLNLGGIGIPADARLASGTDLLAELVPDLYHLLEDEAKECRCGGLDREGSHLRPLDPFALHHATGPGQREEWRTLIRDTAIDLDATDRSRPLEDRPLTEDSAAQAREARLCAECFHLAVLASCYPAEPPRCSEERLREFVLAWIDRRVYSDLHCARTDLLPMIFMCLTLAPPMPQDYAEKVGLIFEYLNEAGPRSINGQPCFTSHRLLHVDDWKRVRPVIQAEQVRRENLVI